MDLIKLVNDAIIKFKNNEPIDNLLKKINEYDCEDLSYILRDSGFEGFPDDNNFQFTEVCPLINNTITFRSVCIFNEYREDPNFDEKIFTDDNKMIKFIEDRIDSHLIGVPHFLKITTYEGIILSSLSNSGGYTEYTSDFNIFKSIEKCKEYYKKAGLFFEIDKERSHSDLELINIFKKFTKEN